MEEYKYLRYIGGRKFIIAALSLASATALVYFGKIVDGVYATVVVSTVGAYIAGNVFTARNTDAS